MTGQRRIFCRILLPFVVRIEAGSSTIELKRHDARISAGFHAMVGEEGRRYEPIVAASTTLL